jgi:hypothetical protein
MEPSVRKYTVRKCADIAPGLLVNMNREMVPFGRSFVDDKNAISVTLMNEVFKKAIVLEVTTVNEEDGAEKNWERQAGLIGQGRITPSLCPARTLTLVSILQSPRLAFKLSQ